MTATLVLLRHGESTWNRANRFTGWHDADLTPKGESQAQAAGAMLAERGVVADVVHTSLQTRAIRTANIALHHSGRPWIPVRRHWRLNERHYGDLIGLNKDEVGREHGQKQLMAWRRGYDTPPPAMRAGHPYDPAADPRYAPLPPQLIQRTECLKDVTSRLLPYWYDQVVPDLTQFATVLIAAHGNTLRALVKHLDAISETEVEALDIPIGIPLVYELNQSMFPATTMPTVDRCVIPSALAAQDHR